MALLIAAGHAASVTFDRVGWLSDLRQLRDAMSVNYANLEWAVSDRGLDLPAVYGQAERGLQTAKDNETARAVLQRFVRVFGDGHFEIRWPAPSTTEKAAPLCSSLGYFDLGDSAAIATHLKDFMALPARGAPDIPAGIVIVSGRRVGVLRIPMFAPQGFPGICRAVLAAMKMKPDSPCNYACQEKLNDLADERYLAEVTTQLRAPNRAKPDVLLVDIADNGGGNDTVDAIARMVTGKMLPMPRMGFVRNPQWAARFESDRKIVVSGLADAKGVAHPLRTLIGRELVTARNEALRPCNRNPLWEGRAITCFGIVIGPLYAGGYVRDELPVALRHEAWADTLSATASFEYTTGLWRGPLIVLVDHNTASASELFAAVLQDNRAALIIGSPTYGAGCGHALPEKDIILAHSGAHVSIPDCIRLRADGTNEVGGVTPEDLIAFRENDTPHQRTKRLEVSLPHVIAKAFAGH